MSAATENSRPLPEFRSPPVHEVAISAQFEPLKRLRIAHVGDLWEQYRAELPVVEEHPPLARLVEEFGPGQKGSRIEFTESIPFARTWFRDEKRTRIVQFQRDRFVTNWRRNTSDDEYPHYHRLRGEFVDHWQRFTEFVNRNDLGELQLNQWEITYVNFEQLEGETFSSPEAARIVSLFSSSPVDKFLLDSGESFCASSSYVINDDVSNEPIARLHVSLDPAVLAADPSVKAFRFQLTARGGIQGSDSTVMMSKADIGHEWIVRSFASLTTSLMHEKWGRTQ